MSVYRMARSASANRFKLLDRDGSTLAQRPGSAPRYLALVNRGREPGINQHAHRKLTTFFRSRLIVLVALTTGMRISEIFGLKWDDLLYEEELIAVRAMLKGGKVRYVPMPRELASEFNRYPAVLGEERIFPPEPGTKRARQRVDKSFETILELAGIAEFRFHDLRHTFASWYMMNGGDLYELAKILGHSNIKMTERYAKLGRNTWHGRVARRVKCGD